MLDEGALQKLLKFEIGKISEGYAVEQRSLEELLREERPWVMGKRGKYVFDRDALLKLSKLPEDIHPKLKLPMNFYADIHVSDSLYMTDENAARALKLLGEISPKLEFRDGKLWISRAIALEIMRKYPTIAQIVIR